MDGFMQLGGLAAERSCEGHEMVAIGYLLIRISLIQRFGPYECCRIVGIPLKIPWFGPNFVDRNFVCQRCVFEFVDGLFGHVSYLDEARKIRSRQHIRIWSVQCCD